MIHREGKKTICCEIVRANLGTCFVHAGFAKSELEAGRRGMAESSFGLARSGYDAMLRFLGRVEDQCQREEVHLKLVQLGEKLEFLQWKLKPAALVAKQLLAFDLIVPAG
jgi:hypothetical protein